MKKWMIPVILVSMLLAGCAAEETVYETIADDLVVPAMAQPREISVKLPGEADISAIDGDTGRLYLCDGYEIAIETLEAGDLNGTLLSVCGHNEDELTVIKTKEDDLKRYDFVWTAAGEKGDLLGRGAILDDGNYHYVLTVLREITDGPAIQIIWSDVFDSFSLA